MKGVRRVLRWLFYACVIAVGVSYFGRTRLGGVTEIDPACLEAPQQRSLGNAAAIEFERNGYAYTARPLATYVLCGLVVRRFDYGWWVIDRSESAFPMDLCVIWGSNLRRGVHREPSVKFSQDCRFCFARWDGDVVFDPTELSNNHLVVDDPAMERQLSQVLIGDQVRLRGQLVNVTGRRLERGDRYDSANTVWNSSTVRTDDGPGACEVLYVEEVAVLRAANPVARTVYRFALAGTAVLGVALLVFWFRG